MAIAAIVISLLVLILLAWRGISVIVLAPACAMLAVLIDGQLPVVASYTQIFMVSVGQFIAKFFPLFVLGAVFGRLMQDSGSAAKIAQLIVRLVGPRRTMLAVVLSCAALTYGGVSLFVVVFAVFPLCRTLFQTADIPRRLIPAAIALGSFTFTMTALPGTVQIQNLIPMPFFRTNSFAAPGLGCIGGGVMFALGLAWLMFRERQARGRGEGFGEWSDTDLAEIESVNLPPAWAALLPVCCMIGLNYVFSQHVIPYWEAGYLADEKFGSTNLSRVQGNWSTILSMAWTLLVTMAIHYRSARRLQRAVTDGAAASLLPVFNTASEVGYGTTIAALSGFAAVRQAVTSIAPGNPLISEAIAVNALAAITGSASGGLSIALEALGETYYQRALETGINPELLHRIASMSCGGLDSLPHNGALITLLIICGVTHRQSYQDVAVVTVLCPLAGTLCVLTLGTLFGSF